MAEQYVRAGGYRDIVVVAGLTLVCFMIYGATSSSLGLFINPMRAELGWTNGQASRLSSAFLFTSALSALGAGWLLDRLGARIVMVGSLLLVTAGYYIASISTAAATFIVAFAIGGIGKGGATFVPCVYVLTRRMPNKLGIALGTVLSGAAAGSAILPMGVQSIVDLYDWRTAMVSIAVGTLVVAVPVVLCLVPHRREPVPDEGPDAGADRSSPSFPVRPLALVLTMQFLFTASAYGALVHMVPLLRQKGFEASEAVGLYGVANAVGAIALLLTGRLADRQGAARTMLGAIVVNAISLLMLGLIAKDSSIAMLGAFLVAWGASSGCCTQLTPMIINKVVPRAALARSIGVSGLVYGLAGATGPVIAGACADWNGSTGLVLSLTMLMSLSLLPLLFAAKSTGGRGG